MNFGDLVLAFGPGALLTPVSDSSLCLLKKSPKSVGNKSVFTKCLKNFKQLRHFTFLMRYYDELENAKLGQLF